MSDSDAASSASGADRPRPRASFGPVTKEALINTWLRELYLDYAHKGGDVSITVEDFLHITATARSDPPKSWLSEDQLTLPLILSATNVDKRSDTLVISTNPASHLANIGLGLNTRDGFVALYPEVWASMSEEKIRWIVVPCNDYMTAQAEAELAAEKAAKNKNTPSEKDGPGAGPHNKIGEARPTKALPIQNEEVPKIGIQVRGGTHWGFMIIDKTNEDAWWLDGHLTITRGPKGFSINHMFRAGWVAGKVLCGYDTVMERRPGQFTASTLKHVPHDWRDNRYKKDEGSACGPWVFAMLLYILKHPHFLTADQGLKGTFARSKLNRHIHDLNFDSVEARRAMQDVIQREAEKSPSTNGLPFRLTIPIINTLDLIDSGIALNGLNRFLGKPSAVTPPTRASRSGGGFDDDGDEDDDEDNEDGYNLRDAPPEELAQLIESNPDDYHGSEEQQLRQAFGFWVALQKSQHLALEEEKKRKQAPPINIIEALKDHDAAFVSMPTAMVTDFVNIKPIGEALTTDQDEWQQRLVLQHIFGRIDNLTPEETALWRTKDPRFRILKNTPGIPWTHERTVELLKKEVASIGEPDVRGKPLYYPSSYIDALTARLTGSGATKKRKGYPDGETVLPNFARATTEILKKWIDANPELFSTRKPGHNEQTDRAVLHRHFKLTFRKESMADLDEVWSYDGAVFGKVGLGVKKGDEVLRMMREHYEEMALRLDARAAQLEAEIAKKRRLAGKPPVSKKRKADEEAAAGQDLKRQKTSDDVVPDDPKKIKWWDVPEDVLQRYLTNSVLNSSTIKSKAVNAMTHRAILFVKYGGRFDKEPEDRLKDFWIHDRNVFNHYRHKNTGVDVVWRKNGEHKIIPAVADIRNRMRDAYEGPLGVEDVSESSEGSSEEE